MYTIIRRTLLVVLIVVCAMGKAMAEDWPQWRGPDRTGVSKERGLLQSWPAGGPKLLWIFRDAGIGFSGMSVVGDRLYSMGADDDDKEYVYAVDLNTQKKLWSVEVGDRYALGNDSPWLDGPRCTPTIDGNFLYALGARGQLVCVETSSGRKVWSLGLVTNLGAIQPKYGYCESPLVDGDQLVVTPGGKKGTLAAINKRTGKLRWRSKTFTNEAWSASMIAIESGSVRQYVQVTHGTVAGVRASDGKLLWKYATAGENGTPVYRDDCVYISDDFDVGGSHLLKLLPQGNQFKTELIYRNRAMRNDPGGVVLVGEYIYGYSNNGGWMCQGFKTGKVAWKKTPHRVVDQGSVTFADGNLYGYHRNKGDVLLIKATPAGYREQGKFRIPEESKIRIGRGRIYTHPVVANGKLYLRDQELIFCYDVHKPQ